MKALFGTGMGAAMLLACGTLASAQVKLRPGQIAIASEVSVPGIAATGGSPVISRDIKVDKAEERHDRIVKRVWIASMLAMAGASGLDAGTSWGKQEANGLLASSDGTFGARGLSIKAGTAAAIILPQILFRKHKDFRAKFAMGNFAGAAVFTGVAIHNVGIHAPSQ